MNNTVHIDNLLPTAISGFCVEDRVEPERLASAQTYMRITEDTLTDFIYSGGGLLEFILSPSNLNLAYKQVTGNGGSGGVDGLSTSDLLPYLLEHKDSLLASIYSGGYRPAPVRSVAIPKSGGKKRQLGIPTVVDRLIQQAISQVLTPIFDRGFSDHSYGFRPGRSAHGALRKCLDYMNSGLTYVVDLDLERFFDTVNHSKLIEVLSRTIKDGRVVSLIHKYLNAGVLVNGHTTREFIGVAQGGPLSPLLSNILLNELDKELEFRGHSFVRYADDVIILCGSKRSAERTLSHLVPFIEGKLFLKVNREKTKVCYLLHATFLSYSFTPTGRGIILRISKSASIKLKDHLRLLTSRSNGWGHDYRKQRLNWYVRGWVSYFRLANMSHFLRDLDSWFRRRMRMCIWKGWKRIRTRYRNLLKLGLPESRVRIGSFSRKGCWRLADSPILKEAMSDDRLRRAGYLFFSDQYRIVKL